MHSEGRKRIMCEVPPPVSLGELAGNVPRTESLQSIAPTGRASKGAD